MLIIVGAPSVVIPRSDFHDRPACSIVSHSCSNTSLAVVRPYIVLTRSNSFKKGKRKSHFKLVVNTASFIYVFIYLFIYLFIYYVSFFPLHCGMLPKFFHPIYLQKPSAYNCPNSTLLIQFNSIQFYLYSAITIQLSLGALQSPEPETPLV